jgi:nucleotide-binding universal stress UspA family protein
MKSKKRRRILVPIDFSEESMKTLRVAKLLAERWRAQLDLLHVIPPLPSSSTLYPAMLPIAPSARRTASADLKRLKDFAFEQSVQPLPYSCTIRLGAAGEEINEIARKTSTDLITIATRGYTGLKYAFLGSTTAQVMRTAPCPVLVVREVEYLSAKERARRGRTPLGFKKVLVPLDFSECSRVGLDYALGVAREFRSSLLLFHCVVPPTYALGAGHTALAGPKLIASQQEFAQDEMENLYRELDKKSVEIEMLVGLGSPVEQINECIRRQGVDLVVTSTHGRTGLKRLFIGSTAEQIVRHAICPVLVVPNRPPRRRRENSVVKRVSE